MATYNQERIIKEYWEKVKNQYPDVPFSKFSEACKYPAVFIKNTIKSGSLVTIMIKWMGKFIVYPARLKRELNRKEVFFNKGIIPEEDLLDYKEKYETFMEKYKEESPGFILIKDTPLVVGTAGEMDNTNTDIFYEPIKTDQK